jgi:IS30 family transposase
VLAAAGSHLSIHEMTPRNPQLDDRDWLEREYVERGCSSADIAGELKCGKTTVRDALRRHGLERRPRGRIPKQDVSSGQMAATRAKGLTLHAIARELGVSVSTVWRRLAASPEPRE